VHSLGEIFDLMERCCGRAYKVSADSASSVVKHSIDQNLIRCTKASAGKIDCNICSYGRGLDSVINSLNSVARICNKKTLTIELKGNFSSTFVGDMSTSIAKYVMLAVLPHALAIDIDIVKNVSIQADS